MTYSALHKMPDSGPMKADAIYCTSVTAHKEIPFFAKQFLMQRDVEVVESKSRLPGCYWIAALGSETATKMQVDDQRCTARKALCI